LAKACAEGRLEERLVIYAKPDHSRKRGRRNRASAEPSRFICAVLQFCICHLHSDLANGRRR
jgi:hypothetical protein